MPKRLNKQWQRDITYLLYDVSRLLDKRFAERMTGLGPTESQWRVIGFLNRSEGLTQTELSLLAGIQKAPLGEHIDKLEAMNWVERRHDPDDRRVKRLFLTGPARTQAQLISRRFKKLSRELQDDIGPQQWRELQRILGELAAGLSPGKTVKTLSQLKLDHNLHIIGVLSRQLARRFDNALKRLGFTRAQWLVLWTTIHTEGISQTELGGFLGIAKAPLGQILDELERKRWLIRKQDSNDRRINRLKVADTAKPAINRLIQDYQASYHEMADLLGSTEISKLKTALSRLRSSLEIIGANKHAAANITA